MESKDNSKPDPWRNVITSKKIEELTIGLQLWDNDPDRRIVFGIKDFLNNEWKRSIILVGTDVSGNLHLGHISLLLIARIFENLLEGKLIVSINEIESLLSRDSPIREIFTFQQEVLSMLHKFNLSTHSRVFDSHIILLALYLWKYLIDDKCPINFQKFYDISPSIKDLLSISIMAVTPAVISFRENINKVIAIYGKDEISHLAFMYELYSSAWFSNILQEIMKITSPRFSYIVINLLPTLSGKHKMSKTLPEETIFVDQIGRKRVSCPQSILDYLKFLLIIAEQNGINKTEEPLCHSIEIFLKHCREEK